MSIWIAAWMVFVGLSCIGVAGVHDHLGQTRLIQPAVFPTRQARGLVAAIWRFSALTWAISGLLIAVSPWLFDRAHVVLPIAFACVPLAYGAVANAVITHGRHFGWKLLTGLVAAALMGASVWTLSA